MDTRKRIEQITREIEAAAPKFDPNHAIEALGETNVYLFRYFPKLKMIVLTERTCEAFQCKPVYYNMPDSFGDEFVYDRDRHLYDKMYADVDAGVPTASSEFRTKNGMVWCRVTLTTVEWDNTEMPEVCAGVVENRSDIRKVNEELKNLLSMQNQMVESLSCGVLAYTLPNRETLLVNEEAKRIFDYMWDARKNFGSLMMEKILPEDHDVIRQATFSLKQVGDRVDYKFHTRKLDGTVLAVECFTKLLAFDDGRRYILSGMLDVTEQESLQTSLKRERKMYRDALTSGCEYSFAFDITLGLVREPIITAHGLDITESLGLELPVSYDMLYAQFAKKNRIRLLDESMWDGFQCAGLIRAFKSGHTTFEAEYYMPAFKTFTRCVIIMSKNRNTGHIYGLCMATDTTTQRNREEIRRKELEDAREELAASNEELQRTLISEREKIAVIEAISNIYFAIYHINLVTGQYHIINDTSYMKTILKDTRDASAGFHLYVQNVIAETFRQKITDFTDLSTLKERMKSEKIISAECMDIHQRWIKVSFIDVWRDDDGGLLEVLYVSEWIDEEKRKELVQQQALADAYEAANRASAAKTRFLASMSHDIRTPMNAIIGMTAIAGTHLDDKERVSDCLSKITVSSKHLLGLINEVLDMNKIESGKLDLNLEEINLANLVDNLLTMLKPQIEGSRHELSVRIQNVEHERVIGDSQRIQQVFMNLMSNAVKYTPPGGNIKLTISEKPTNRRRIGCYEFIFEDNGIGMSEDFLPQLFEPFTRAKDSTVDKMQGTGLGMAISRNIVRMMNGDIQVESQLGVGTKFTVTIFLELQDVDENIDIPEFVDLPVLVADDDRMACESTCEVLCDLGMKGEWVLTGREAVEKVVEHHDREEDFFAVILDWRMPDMDGIKTTKEIRRRVGSGVPIIIISAYDWSDIELEARAAGADAFISKPLFKSRMAHLFKMLLGKERDEQSGSELDELAKENFIGKRALLVEDNELNAEIAGEILGMVGLEIEYAKDGKEAVNRMEEIEDDYYDIIFMDIQMPVMNGYEATRAIRAMPRPYTKRVPIIAMTANAFAEDVQAAVNVGMNEHIAKPLNFGQLTRTLNRWLGA